MKAAVVRSLLILNIFNNCECLMGVLSKVTHEKKKKSHNLDEHQITFFRQITEKKQFILEGLHACSCRYFNNN